MPLISPDVVSAEPVSQELERARLGRDFCKPLTRRPRTAESRPSPLATRTSTEVPRTPVQSSVGLLSSPTLFPPSPFVVGRASLLSIFSTHLLFPTDLSLTYLTTFFHLVSSSHADSGTSPVRTPVRNVHRTYSITAIVNTADTSPTATLLLHDNPTHTASSRRPPVYKCAAASD